MNVKYNERNTPNRVNMLQNNCFVLSGHQRFSITDNTGQLINYLS